MQLLAFLIPNVSWKSSKSKAIGDFQLQYEPYPLGFLLWHYVLSGRLGHSLINGLNFRFSHYVAKIAEEMLLALVEKLAEPCFDGREETGTQRSSNPRDAHYSSI